MSATISTNPGMAGIQKGLQDAFKAANSIASADSFSASNTTDLAEQMVALKTAEQQVSASAKVVRAIEDSVGHLLDEYA